MSFVEKIDVINKSEALQNITEKVVTNKGSRTVAFYTLGCPVVH